MKGRAVVEAVRHGTVTDSPACSRRHSKHTVWWWTAGDPIPVPCEAVLDNHADMLTWVADVLGKPEPPPATLRWVKAFRTHNEAYECFHWHNDAPWPPPHHHMAQDIYTRRARDWFRKRYWVRCWECDLHDGPYRTVTEVKAALLVANEMTAP